MQLNRHNRMIKYVFSLMFTKEMFQMMLFFMFIIIYVLMAICYYMFCFQLQNHNKPSSLFNNQ